MADAHKCDVLNCPIFEQGAPSLKIIIDDLGQAVSVCVKHAEEIVNKYFPHLIKEEEVPVETGATPQEGGEVQNV